MGSLAPPEDFSLVPKILPFLDRHLIYPLFAEDTSLEATKLKYELLKTSNMTDFVGGLEKELKGLPDIPKEYDKKREVRGVYRKDH
jgi:translation initiation factor 3 subunit E